MENLEKIYEYVNDKDSTMILIINNNSKLLFDSLFNSIYKKYSSQKTKLESRKGLMRKLIKIKDRLIKIDFDLKKVQFSSSTNSSKIWAEFNELKLSVLENNSKMLFRMDINNANLNFTQSKIYDIKYYIKHNVPQYNIFDLIILVDVKNIRLIRRVNFYDDETYDINTLIRAAKLKQLQKKIKKES